MNQYGYNKRFTGKPKYLNKRRRLAEGVAAIAVSKVAQRSRGRGISSASVFQNVSTRPEKKFLDLTTTLNVAAATATGTLSGVLNGCAQGVDVNQHIGRQTRMVSLYWLWQGNIGATSTLATPVRLVIIYDKEAEGAAPTIAAAA